MDRPDEENRWEHPNMSWTVDLRKHNDIQQFFSLFGYHVQRMSTIHTTVARRGDHSSMDPVYSGCK